jgi:hypothetical protein
MAISNPMAPPITNNNSSSRGTRYPVRKWPIVADALTRATIAQKGRSISQSLIGDKNR